MPSPPFIVSPSILMQFSQLVGNRLALWNSRRFNILTQSTVFSPIATTHLHAEEHCCDIFWLLRIECSYTLRLKSIQMADNSKCRVYCQHASALHHSNARDFVAGSIHFHFQSRLSQQKLESSLLRNRCRDWEQWEEPCESIWNDANAWKPRKWNKDGEQVSQVRVMWTNCHCHPPTEKDKRCVHVFATMYMC